jgi:hypothetical protein
MADLVETEDKLADNLHLRSCDQVRLKQWY